MNILVILAAILGLSSLSKADTLVDWFSNAVRMDTGLRFIARFSVASARIEALKADIDLLRLLKGAQPLPPMPEIGPNSTPEETLREMESIATYLEKQEEKDAERLDEEFVGRVRSRPK